MVKEISNQGEFDSEIRGPGLVVVDFFAHWCGPCKQIAPFIEQLAQKYKNVKFLKVDVDQCQDVAASRRVSAMPTFQFFVGGNMVDEMKGADPTGIESRVVKFKVDVDPFVGKGFTLGAPQETSQLSLREMRLKAMGIPAPAPSSDPPKAPTQAPQPSTLSDEDEEIAKALALSMEVQVDTPQADTSSSSSTSQSHQEVQDARDLAEAEAEQKAEDDKWGEEMVPVPVNTELLAQLIEMGFSDTVSRKGLVHGGSLEGALGWIGEHQDDADINQPYMVKRSEATPRPVLTEEEKAAQLQAMKQKIAQRKSERARAEKEAEIKREKERRERGQKMGEIQEDRDRMMRKREAENVKREKMEAEKERQRLRAEIARDKELRRLNKGVLPSVLGVDGYAPSAVQYEGGAQPAEPNASAPAPAPSGTTAAPSAAPKFTPAPAPAPKPRVQAPPSAAPAESRTPSQVVDAAIETLLKYRTAGAGGNALKLLITFVSNVADNPTEQKYRSINCESGAFKSKLAPLVGPVLLLKALGFQKIEEDAKLRLDGDVDSTLFTETVAKLVRAEAQYRAANP